MPRPFGCEPLPALLDSESNGGSLKAILSLGDAAIPESKFWRGGYGEGGGGPLRCSSSSARGGGGGEDAAAAAAAARIDSPCSLEPAVTDRIHLFI